jgi:hypothetical protein
MLEEGSIPQVEPMKLLKLSQSVLLSQSFLILNLKRALIVLKSLCMIWIEKFQVFLSYQNGLKS